MTTTETPSDELAVFLDEARKRYCQAGTSPNLARSLESWIASANDVPELVAEVVRLRAELRRAEDACQLLGRVVTDLSRTLDAARIELVQGKPANALEWILNAAEPADDDPEVHWNGTETAQEWFDRTDGRASGAAPDVAEPEMAGQLPLPGVTATPEGVTP